MSKMKMAAFLLSTAALSVSLNPLPVQAQVRAEVPAAKADAAFAALPGRWVRPDGGYVINIRGVAASGKLDAWKARPSSSSSKSAPAATTDRPTP